MRSARLERLPRAWYSCFAIPARLDWGDTQIAGIASPSDFKSDGPGLDLKPAPALMPHREALRLQRIPPLARQVHILPRLRDPSLPHGDAQRELYRLGTQRRDLLVEFGNAPDKEAKDKRKMPLALDA